MNATGIKLLILRLRLACIRLRSRARRALGLREPKLSEHQRAGIRWILRDAGADPNLLDMVDAEIDARERNAP